jgi:hypothetical protein
MNKQLAILGLLLMPSTVGAQGVCPKGHAVQALEAEYTRVRKIAEMYQRSGMGFEYSAELKKLQNIINRFPQAYLEQEIQTFPLTRDPRCLAAAYSQVIGREVQFQPRSDGRWNIYVGGSLRQEAVSDDKLLSLIKKTT